MGLRKVGANVGSKTLLGGFKVGSAKKSKDWVVGLKSLDLKHYSVVLIDENNNPNFTNSIAGKDGTGSAIPSL